jgi:hypothetical protein
LTVFGGALSRAVHAPILWEVGAHLEGRQITIFLHNFEQIAEGGS